MTKKDYELIAGCFNWFNTIQLEQDTKDLEPETVDSMRTASKDIAETLADNLERENPRFNRDKFLKACGLEADNERD